MTGMTSQMSFLLLQDEEDSRAEFQVGFSFNGKRKVLAGVLCATGQARRRKEGHTIKLTEMCCEFILGLHTYLPVFTLPDLPTGSYIQEDLSLCSSLCEAGRDCCDLMASCKCGTHTGQYDCICEKGYYGKGLQHECTGNAKRLCYCELRTMLTLPSSARSC